MSLDIKETDCHEISKVEKIDQLDETKRTEKIKEHGDDLEKNQEIKPMETNLTTDEKKELKEVTGWSNEIVDNIKSPEEAEIYKNASLEEAKIDGRECLIKTDIDLTKIDERGRTNSERMEKGLAPLDKNGDPIELHHIGQKMDSPLAELEWQEHRGKGNDAVLHDKTKETEIDRADFDKERSAHWENR